MVDVLTGMRENMKFIFKANIEKETVKFTGYNCKTSQKILTLKKNIFPEGYKKK